MIDTEVHSQNQIDVSPRMALLFNGLAVTSVTLASLLPAIALIYWLVIDPDSVRDMTGLTEGVLPDIEMGQRIAAASIALLAALPLAWGLARLKTCLNCFAAGQPFAARGIAGLRDFALGCMVSALARLLSHTAMTLVLTWNAAPGHRQLAVQVNADLMLLVMFAGIIAALAWALEKAAVIADENSQFV